MRVEVDAASVDAAFTEMIREFAHEARLPGFRPGKAPQGMVAKLYAKQIETEVKRKLISDSYQKAVADQKLHPAANPDIEEIQFGRGKALQFAATLETIPEFELPEYKGIPVRRESAVVTAEDQERAMQVLREKQAAYNAVSRPMQAGDVAVVSFAATIDGKSLAEIAPDARGLAEQKEFWIQAKEPSFLPGFADQLLGAKKGDHRVVEITFPADFSTPQLSGKKAAYAVEVVEVKEQILPAIDEAFAKSFGAENVDQLRAGVLKDLEHELKYKQQRLVRNQIVRSLLDRVNFDLPESMLLNETKHVIYDLVRENTQRGVSKESIDKQKNEIYNFAASNARERLKIAFLLGKIADKEGIQVSQEDVAQRILQMAEMHQIHPTKLAKQLQERNGIGEIREQIGSAKVLDFLELSAKIEEGAPAAPVPPPPS